MRTILFKVVFDVNVKAHRLFAQTDGSYYRDLGCFTGEPANVRQQIAAALAQHALAFRLGNVQWMEN